MVHKFWVRIAFFCLLSASLGVHSSEPEDRMSFGMEVSIWFDSYNFGQLEQAAEGLRRSGERTASGIWKLAEFHDAAASSFRTDRQDQGFWKGRKAHVDQWISKYPNSAAAHLAHARMLLNSAWSYRGDGLGNEVAAGAWQPFYEGTELAAQYLIANKRFMASDPDWYRLMIIVAYRLGWKKDQFQPILDEALRTHPKYHQIYFSAIDYFAPKWGGSAELIELFARKSAEIAKRAGEPGMYARMYWVAIDGQFKGRTFQESRIHWPTMKAAMREVLQAYPDEWNIQNFARFSCLAGDSEMTAELLSRMRGFVIEEAWRQYAPYERCKRWAMNKTKSVS